MDSRTRDETRLNNLSQPNEVSNPNAEPMDNSNNDSGTKEFIYKNNTEEDNSKRAKSPLGPSRQESGQPEPQEDPDEAHDAYTQKQLMLMDNMELLKI